MNKSTKNEECGVQALDEPIDQSFWNTQWENKTIGWDVGYASPAITTYMAQYPNKNAAILIPGCGNAYEAAFLVENGFNNITLLDFAPKAVDIVKQKFLHTKAINVLCEDFFEHQGKYDLVIEQTFFCAIMPIKRIDYAIKMAEILNSNGKLIGVLFDKIFKKGGPPFGGSLVEYLPIFEPLFTIKEMNNCYNSIRPRANTEVFINFVKKTDIT